ncbi:hypothetical protein Pla108_34930 [Botrimarina colliarenosi]|uniref:Putative zinc-finger domain-containing protein n=1 Tax=Botrimarina colliarenosi TaxID=2528001 RepID=A0A5C6A7I7_9BACT|nr:zf-HC2 domain-containing protein [Botrimarina colliarenosi]TWT95347.1 hypothetical protein Pla108_34930 [Botrimarina colliarenosi]
MACRDIQPLLTDYAAGAATPEERRLVETHLAEGCHVCTNELAALEEAAMMLFDAEPLPTPPPRLRAAVLSAIEAHPQEVQPLFIERPATVAPASKPARRWQTALALAACLSAIAFFVNTVRNNRAAPQAAIDAVAQAWRERVQESERQLGVRGAKLVSLSIDPFQNAVVTHLLYDSLSEQLHLWATRNPISANAEPNWAWVLDADGAVIAKGRLAPASLGRLVAVLDIGPLETETAEVLLTVEDDVPTERPSDDVVEQGVLRIR